MLKMGIAAVRLVACLIVAVALIFIPTAIHIGTLPANAGASSVGGIITITALR